MSFTTCFFFSFTLRSVFVLQPPCFVASHPCICLQVLVVDTPDISILIRSSRVYDLEIWSLLLLKPVPFRTPPSPLPEHERTVFLLRLFAKCSV
ncbi:hypothetical protein BDY19DRAFT_12240 [Irpex rosettiformis]|uniref:Uncharacterized protein n=1 Tax=Irpex rosettiformis TaxID=378272 RepID=A0ACB8UIY1_9APHY|nr:hypothetical protein BDY19DRAFT_12240 [Irpex rosettiformis]